MKRWLYVSHTLNRSLEAVSDTLGHHGVDGLLGDAAQVGTDGSFTTAVQVRGVPFTPALRVRLGVGAQRPDGRWVVPLTWTADSVEAAFPGFSGALELEGLAADVTRVSVVGCYVPPLGPLGAALDVLFLHGVAEATAGALLDRVVGVLEGSGGARVAASGRALRVGDVMSHEPVLLQDQMPLKTAALLLFHLQVSGAPVVTADGDLVGVLTESDLLDKEAVRPSGLQRHAAQRWRRREAVTVGQACSQPALTTTSAVALHDAVGEMRRHRVRRLVVVDNTRIVGMLTRHDALAALVRSDEEIRSSINALLDDSHESTMFAEVEWGRVRLVGTLSRRSRLEAMIDLVGTVDGVMAVDAHDLEWAEDDVVAASPLVPF